MYRGFCLKLSKTWVHVLLEYMYCIETHIEFTPRKKKKEDSGLCAHFLGFEKYL